MLRIVTVVGARPQFIKASAVSRIICNMSYVEEVIVHTGQHYDENMSEIFFRQLEIPEPGYNLGVSGVSHGAMTGKMLEGLEGVLRKVKPDVVLVYGDTNSTLAGALAASKMHIPVAHVEAGLRSNNPFMPEEINRVLTDRVSSFLFCPTDTALKNLKSEGFPFPSVTGECQKVVKSGDVMKDVVDHYGKIARTTIGLEEIGVRSDGYILTTLHRQENLDCDSTLQNLIRALAHLSQDTNVVIPMHPRLIKRMSELNLSFEKDNVTLLEPLPYLQMQRLLMSASLLVTDSGGLQKEAFFHEIPCVTLRTETEWLETVAAGRNCLLNPESSLLAQDIQDWHPADISADVGVYGDGNAAREIVDCLVSSI